MNEGKSIYMNSCWMPWLLLALCIIQPLVTCHCITGSLWVTSSYSLTTDARKAVQSRGCDWASLQAARGCQISPECLRSPSRNLCFIPLAGTVSEKDGQRGSVYFIVKKGYDHLLEKKCQAMLLKLLWLLYRPVTYKSMSDHEKHMWTT